MNAIFRRRSIRKFLDTPVPAEDVKKILMAGMAAPSAKDNREWVFIRMTDKAAIEQFISVHPNGFAMRTAPLNILVCADLRKCKIQGDWWIMDGSAALENMLIEATELGYGSLCVGVHPDPVRIDKITELCALPDYIRPVGILAAGKTEKVKEPHDRYLEERVHQDRYAEREEA